MSLNRNKELMEVAIVVRRDLRENSTTAGKIFWEAVRNKKFIGKKFYRQYPLFYDITEKESFFVADFYYHDEKLVIELDGKMHQHRLVEDAKRTKIINYLGLKILRFSNEDVINNLSEILNKITKNIS